MSARDLLPRLPRAAALIADRGYDSNWFRNSLTERGTTPCIPPIREYVRQAQRLAAQWGLSVGKLGTRIKLFLKGDSGRVLRQPDRSRRT
jgi:hypothetical protein